MPLFREQFGLIRSLADQPITPTVVLSLRRQVGESQARVLLELASLQHKAIQKFGTGVWLATVRSLQQSSTRVVADYKASLMGDRGVFDLCGGIGGDAMGFARRGPVVTIDRDPTMTRMAGENLLTSSAEDAVAVCADVVKYLPQQKLRSANFGLHIDPDRRPGGLRTSDPAAYEPTFAAVMSMVLVADASIVKLAPAAELSDDESVPCHRQWISYAGSVREQTVLYGDCISAAYVTTGTRSALRLLKDGRREVFQELTPHSSVESARAPSPRRYIIDFDPAVRAAGLSSAFAERHGLKSLGDPSGFFTTDNVPHDSLLMQCFECLWFGPADQKQIRKHVLGNRLQVQVVRVRGSDHDPAKLQRQLGVCNGTAVSLLIGRNANQTYAVLGKRQPISGSVADDEFRTT